MKFIKLLVLFGLFWSENAFSQKLSLVTEIDTFISTNGFKLPAIITLPESKTFPIVILIHGSGPIDKDCTIGPNKIFKQLADSLTIRGIAVLRFDKRTKVYPTAVEAMIDSFTIEDETINDVDSAISLAQSIKGVDKQKFFLVGHSLGAMVCPSILKNNKLVHGAIMLASSAFPFEDVIVKQFEYLYSLDTTNKAIERQIPILKDKAKAVKQINKDTLIDKFSLPLNLPQSYWVSLAKNYPGQYLAYATKPILILQGARDYQSTMEDFSQLQKDAMGNKKITFKAYDKLNHLFFEGTSKSTPAEYYIYSIIPSYVFDDIRNFIFTH